MWIDERIAIYPETITHEDVLAEPNVERRRMLLERMGYERFMQLGQPDRLNTDSAGDRLLRTALRVYNRLTRHPQLDVINTDYDTGGMRQLLRIRFWDDEPLVCLSVIDPSTGRQYMLRVPPTMTTCYQAAAWVAGFDNPDDYKPLVET